MINFNKHLTYQSNQQRKLPQQYKQWLKQAAEEEKKR